MMDYDEKVKFVHQYLSGELSSEEMQVFTSWRDSDPANTLLFYQLKKIWDNAHYIPNIQFDYKHAHQKHISILESSNENLPSSQKVRHLKDTSKIRFMSIKYKYAIAAIFVLCISTIILMQNDVDKYNGTDRSMITLDDGTKVWLDQNAVLSVNHMNNSKRSVSLSGRAYFDVKSNPKAPFFIDADDIKIQVLGTKFIVNSQADQVSVREGKVEVSADDKKVQITNNEMAILQPNDDIAVIKENFDTSSLWFNEDLSFNKAPFDVVINDVKAYFNVKIILPEHKDWSNCTFTSGPLKTSTMDEILTILKLTYDMDYTRQNDNSIKINKVKCK